MEKIVIQLTDYETAFPTAAVIIPDGRVIITQKNYSGDEDVVVLLFHEILELAKKVKVVMNARMHNET